MDTASRLELLLERSASGDRDAESALLDLVYGELRKLASSLMRREQPGHTLQTSGLVNEAYLRLAGRETIRMENRGMFFTSAARAMRRVLIEHARRKHTAKRDGGARVDLDRAEVAIDGRNEELLAIDRLLEELATLDARQAQIVELRFFAGLTVEQTAEAMSISDRTVIREWAMARAWLKGELEKR
ncbi:MAG TPA: ECF-type sigma factor [Bryobacteraceae bacterium]|nr:ECF-type sigma factor [Bryobacteraceae bacterium]